MNGTVFHGLLLQSYTMPDAFATPSEFDAQEELYINDLIDCVCGLLSADISTESEAALQRHRDQRVAKPATDDRLPRFGGQAREILDRSPSVAGR